MPLKSAPPALLAPLLPKTPLCVSKFVHSSTLTSTLIALPSMNQVLCAVNMCPMSNVRAHGGRHARLCVQHGGFVVGHVLAVCRGKWAAAAPTLWHRIIIKTVREAQRRAFSRVFVHLAFSG
jgi:hypothetical protein